MPNQASITAITVTVQARRVRSLLPPRIDDLRPSPLLVAHGTRTAQLIRAVLVRGRSTAAGVVNGSREQRSVGTTEVTGPAAWARPCRRDQRRRRPESCGSRPPHASWRAIHYD